MPEPTQEQIDAARKAMEYWVPWDLRDRLQGPLDAMAMVALIAAAAVTPEQRFMAPRPMTEQELQELKRDWHG